MSLKKWLSSGSNSSTNDKDSTTIAPNSILANNTQNQSNGKDENSTSAQGSGSSSVSSHKEKHHNCGNIPEEDERDEAIIFEDEKNINHHHNSIQHKSSSITGGGTISTTLHPDYPFGDGSDKVFGMENFGYTCYCNSIVQCLYYTKAFRLEILKNPTSRDLNSRIRKSSMPGNKAHITITNAHHLNPSNNNGNSNEGKTVRQSLGRRTSSFFGRNKKDSITDDESEQNNDTKQPNQPPQQQSQAQQQTQQTQQHNGQTITIPNIKSNSNQVIVGKTDDPNANSDARKRAALFKGPILNVDHSLVDYDMKVSLFTSLKDLFESMIENDSKTGVVSPSYLIETLKKENELFRSTMHQDAHEFLNFLLNEVIDTINTIHNTRKNALHELFEGLLTNQTKCLTCENVSSRDETFLDLSIDLTDNETLETCLKQFSASEMLNGGNKFYCDNCHSLQEAEKKMGLRKLPKILALHLKRFKYSEEHQRNVKLFQKIKYPLYLKLESDIPAEKPEDGLKFYQLYGVVVHIGGGPHHGHYVALVKTIQHGWLLFDDETVEKIDESFVLKFTGDSPDLATAYVLFYQEISEEQYDSNINGSTVKEEVPTSLEKDGGIEEKIIRVDSNNTSINSSQPSTVSSDNLNNNNKPPVRPPPTVLEPPQAEKSRFRTPSLSSIARLKPKSSQMTVNSQTNTTSSSSSSNITSNTSATTATPPLQPQPTASSSSIPQISNVSTLQPNSPVTEQPPQPPTSSGSTSSFWKRREKDPNKVNPVEEKEKKKNRMSVNFGFRKNSNNNS
ncbi:Ubiquitin carboxyl-terminal hydrolase [Wickerhamomyces ciferrii]|uniref:ubiquitinyl hydrolase 1 n=1 Tax=Wickerhamomyces ciferrii (strain ATCC 14091 / BCRC 22168 / CBS 111 / JCM 3599 / NBRC 0793 / NRRL Y-1031 F-60-10) TaxID=1206466 RepID=K0KX19_WICCF|nr:Ubiquitin carboxyl-terminal hydrolase [Wickerhamomyces ciferrii]CCH46597.1 Ubiquitin carboxyl-terminal hydrolase [Wickerhamomyces ciferrii]